MKRCAARHSLLWGRALVWGAAGCVAGPLALGLTGAVRALVDGPPGLESLGMAFGVVVLATSVGATVGAMFAAPFYLPLLLLWATCGRRLGRLESTYGGVVAGTALLAAAGAGLLTLGYGSMDRPFGFEGRDLVLYAISMLLLLWAALLIPRLVLPILRPGSFARVEPPPTAAPEGAPVG